MNTGDTDLWFIVDDDDPTLDEYEAIVGLKVVVVQSTKRGMVEGLNRAFQTPGPWRYGRAVAFLGDDHRPRTVGWDRRYLYELKELGTGFVYGNDLFQGERIPTQVAMTTDIPLTLGYMAPPTLNHLFVDDVWKDLGRGIGKIKYLPDVVVEHLHYLNGKSEEDEGYRLVNSSTMAQHDAREYKKYRLADLPKDIEKLKKLLLGE